MYSWISKSLSPTEDFKLVSNTNKVVQLKLVHLEFVLFTLNRGNQLFESGN